MSVGLINTASVLSAQRYAKLAQLQRASALERLATGTRLNRGSDGPAALIASEGLRATLAILDAETTANIRASNIADVADGAMSQVSDLLIEAKTLVAANANSTGLSQAEKDANQLQIDSIIASVSVISKTTSFLGTKLLDGSGVIAASGKTQKIESTRPEDVGTVEDAGTEYTLADLTSGKALDISGGSSDLASKVIDAAIQSVGTNRGQVGAFQKYQVQTRIHEIDAAREHLVSAVSMIRDTDYAMEVSRGIRAELLEKTSLTAMMVAQTSSFSQHDRQKVLGLFL